VNPSVSLVIVNFNAGEALHSCLESVAADLDGISWDGVVVDNRSSDESWKAVARFAPRVVLLHNDENVGFARGINQGVNATTGGLLLLLNPDCRLRRGMTAALSAELEAHPRAAIVGPRVLDPDGTVQGSARGDPTLFTGLFGRTTVLARLFPRAGLSRHNVRTAEAIASGASSVPVDWVSGACMLARREALAEVGGFDERYFLYWEDADLCRRLRDAGHEIRYVPGAEVVHLVGRSSHSVRALAVREFHRSAYRYYATHVARSWPHRWMAKGLLTGRCWWRMVAGR
jgi:GT2 family glycosyltransferase